MTYRYCTQCGQNLAENSRYCGKCGSVQITESLLDNTRKFKWRKALNPSGRFSRLEFLLFGGGTGAIGWLLALLSPVLLILWLPLELFVSVVAAIRRFHDMDRSGWHLFFGLIPFVGVVVIVILLFSRYEKHKQMGVVRSGIRPRVSMQVPVYTGSSGCRAHYLTIVFNPCAESPKGKVTIRLPGCEGYLTSRWHSRCV